MLLYGVAGAIVLRALFIVAGAAALDTFYAMTYVLGALLAYTAVKIARHGGEQVDPDNTLAMRVLKRVAPAATPAASALVMVAVFDVMFAIDSIPAIFAITRDTFVVFAANAFSLLGHGEPVLPARGAHGPLPPPAPRPGRDPRLGRGEADPRRRVAPADRPDAARHRAARSARRR